MSSDQYLAPAEVAEELGRSYMSVMRMIRTGKLPAQKVGWSWIIARKDLPQKKEAEAAS